jgi:hypothetical protein
MSYDLERAVERAIDRLRGAAAAKRRDGDDWIADSLEEIANSLARPLEGTQRARQREEAQRQAERLRR